MKEDLTRLGLIPEGLKQADESIIKEGNIYDKPQSERFNWLQDKNRLDEKSDTLFYVGCTPAYLRRQIARSSVTVLDKFGIDYMLTNKEMCCGHPFLAAGEIDKAKETAEKTVAEFEKMGIKRIIFDCAGCLVKMHDDDLALKTGIERLQEAETTGAEAVISACPACQTNLLDAARQSGIQLKILYVTELLSQVL